MVINKKGGAIMVFGGNGFSTENHQIHVSRVLNEFYKDYKFDSVYIGDNQKTVDELTFNWFQTMPENTVKCIMHRKIPFLYGDSAAHMRNAKMFAEYGDSVIGALFFDGLESEDSEERQLLLGAKKLAVAHNVTCFNIPLES